MKNIPENIKHNINKDIIRIPPIDLVKYFKRFL